MPLWQHKHLHLECFPAVPEHVSLPWDSADEYLADALTDGTSTLLLNDRYGALSCALPAAHSWADSYCAAIATRDNRVRNSLPNRERLNWPDLPSLQGIREVGLRIPKNNEQLQDQLRLIARHWPEATVKLAGMAKHIPVSLLNWLEANADDYRQHPIVRKARLIEIRGLTAFASKSNDWKGYTQGDLRIEALPGVFCRNQLDPGAAVMLQHLPAQMPGVIFDLGCGNGILSLTIARRNPQSVIIATDDSELATLSVTHNASAAGVTIDVRHGNILSAVSGNADWIVCNPPFHDGHKELTNIAAAMFREARAQLNTDGHLLVVANRHLPYLPMLRKLFRKVDTVSSDKRFCVFDCRP